MGISGNKSSSQGGTKTTHNYNGTRKPPFILQILIWVITGIIISIIMTNVKPYEIIATNYLSGINYSDIAEFIKGIWVIGAIFGFILNFINFGFGFSNY